MRYKTNSVQLHCLGAETGMKPQYCARLLPSYYLVLRTSNFRLAIVLVNIKESNLVASIRPGISVRVNRPWLFLAVLSHVPLVRLAQRYCSDSNAAYMVPCVAR